MSSTTLKIGDTVNVPGSMHGTLKYLGPVHGKKGTFAGVQLAAEFSARGKNNGDVEGRYYFKTSVPGSGIFLPSEKAEKRQSREGGMMGAPGTPAAGERSGIAPLGGFNQGGRTPGAATLPKPNFSQSIGPGAMMRSSSPMGGPSLKAPVRRESLPRPGSPLRKANSSTIVSTPGTAGRLATPRTRPSLGLNKSVNGTPGAGIKSPGVRQSSTLATNRFGQSLRASTRGGVTPSRTKALGPNIPRSETSVSNTTSGTSPLGPESAFDEEEESYLQSNEVDLTPTPAAGRSIRNVTSSSTASTADLEENKRLKDQLAERDRQLNEQAASINDMQASLSELSQLMMNVQQGSANPEEEQELPKEAQELRAALKDKNERIKALTAEFDANRADFRSTIDTLEMASTETERVYERRVEELLEEIRMYQEKNEDVESVAQQFKQLEELVQELEEGLEDARRGEAEARGEVEFLRGEVERGRSELRREKERNRAGDRLNGIEADDGGISSEEFEELQLRLDQKDDEIRGLKVIIQNLNDTAARSPDREKTPKANGNGFHFGHGHTKTMSTNTVVSLGQLGYEDTADHLQQQIRDLESLLDSKSYSDEQLREGMNKLRQSVQFGATGSKVHIPGLGIKQHSRTNSNQLERSNSAGTARQENMRSNTSTSALRSQHSSSIGHRRKDTGVPDFADVSESPVTEEFEDAHEEYQSQPHQTGKQTKESPSVSSQTDASSAAPWCEICEESGHDILNCSNMGFGSHNNDESSTNRTSQPLSSSRPLTGSSATGSMHSFAARDIVRDNLRRSRESPHPPPTTAVPLLPGSASESPSRTKNGNRSTPTATSIKPDVDRPAPLSMNASRHNSTDVIPNTSSLSTTNTTTTSTTNNPTRTSDLMTKKLIDQFPSPSPGPSPLHSPSESTFPNIKSPTSNSFQRSSFPSIVAQSANNNNTTTTKSKPVLLEGTGPQAGMLGGRVSGVIDSDKWCALCERDGHDSVDCPLEDGF